MAATYELIASQVLGSDAATVTFSDIPGTYTDLLVVISARSARSANYGDGLQLSFNASTSNYSKRSLYVDTNVVGSGSAANRLFADVPAASVTASTFGSVELYIPNYAGATNKSYSATGAYENNSATYYNIAAQAGLWSDTSAITSVAFTTSNSQNFVTNSSFQIYGITKA